MWGENYAKAKPEYAVTSAEWLWESLLSVSKTRRCVLQKCSERSESTEIFYCKLCFDDFMKHLSSDEHKQEEDDITSSTRRNKLKREYHLINDFEKRANV